MRKYLRQIAKDRLAFLGAERVNRNMGAKIKNGKNRRMQRTKNNRALYSKQLNEQRKALWREVLFGDLAKRYEKKFAKEKAMYERVFK